MTSLMPKFNYVSVTVASSELYFLLIQTLIVEFALIFESIENKFGELYELFTKSFFF